MPELLWKGKLSPAVKLMVNASSIMAWISGNSSDIAGMKQRIKDGYDGIYTDNVTKYDELGLAFQIKAAIKQLETIDVKGKEVLDVGAGTGALSFLMLEQGAAKVICGDISEYMLKLGREKAANHAEKGSLHHCGPHDSRDGDGISGLGW